MDGLEKGLARLRGLAARVERVEVPVAVERRRSGYERLAVGAFPWLVLAVVLGLVGVARRLARRFF